MDQIPYPSPADILRLNEQIPAWSISNKDFSIVTDSADGADDLFRPVEISSWARMIIHRLKDADYSFIMTSYYLERGIPDEEWYMTSEKGTKYFPNFNVDHDRNKFAFEFYSDVYFYKAFSLLDTLAHLMTIMYGLIWTNDDKVYFYTAVEKLKPINRALYKDLKAIMNSTEYRKINRIRNNSTHNFSDGHVDSGVVREVKKITYTVGKYMTVKEKFLLMQWMCQNLIKIINKVKNK